MTLIALILFKLRLVVLLCCGYIIYRQTGRDKPTLIAASIGLVATASIFIIYFFN